MAEIAPMAEWRPLPRSMSTTPLTHDIICLHTMVGSLAGSWSWSSRAGGSYWHFGCGGGGALWQCQDLRYKSAANLNGNWRVIPIETEDTNSNYFPAWGNSCGNVPWWTDAQLNKLVELVAWLCVRYNIPAVLIPDTRQGRRGIAYHRQGIDPWRVDGGELWSNSAGKCCPDWRRIEQLVKALIPRVQARIGGAPIEEPEPKPEPELEEDMQAIIQGDKTPEWWITNYITRRHLKSTGEVGRIIWTTAANGGKIAVGANNGPIVLPQGDVDNIPRVDTDDTEVTARTELRAIAVGQELERLTKAVNDLVAAGWPTG